jgi:hypothetical protein
LLNKAVLYTSDNQRLSSFAVFTSRAAQFALFEVDHRWHLPSQRAPWLNFAPQVLITPGAIQTS